MGTAQAGRATTVVRSSQATSGTAVLVNPRSFRLGQRSCLADIERGAERHAVPVNVVEGPADIADVLKSPGAETLKRLIVVGGDGTVQALVSLLATRPAPSRPGLLILGGGRTNFTARDLNTHARLDALLALALRGGHHWHEVSRPLLSLQQDGMESPLYGFFVAAALVDHVIRDCHDYRTRHRDWLRTGHLSSILRVAQLGFLGLLGRSDFDPPLMTIDAEGLGQLESPMRILIASSLEHADGWLDPYAARGDGAVRVTAVSTAARGFWRNLPSLLRGRFDPGMQPSTGYLSGRTSSVRLRGLSSVCIDGQEFSLDPTRETTLQAGAEIKFLTP